VKVLIVDDEAPIRSLVRSYLASEGYEVLEASTGEEAVAAVRDRDPDLVVLDVLMPGGIDGVEALRQIRRSSDVAVVMLTARSEETDKLIGLSVGADDYLTKPFSPRELVARIKAVLRRTGQTKHVDEEIVVIGGLRIDRPRRAVQVDGRPVELTALEFELLDALASQPGRVFSRRQLIERIWGWDYFGDERVVDVHIRNLRRALSDDAGEPRFVGTVRNVGYRFVGGQTQ
jgi:DNA-binding response OmpR family regulator